MATSFTPISTGTVPNDGTGDVASVAFGKVNANFTQAAALLDQLFSNAASMTAVSPASVAALQQSVDALGEEIASLQGQIASAITANGKYRPGAALTFFTTLTTGNPTSVPALPSAAVVETPQGPAYGISGPGYVAAAQPVWMAPAGSTVFKAVFVRTQDPSDYNFSVAVGVAWLDVNYEVLLESPFYQQRLVSNMGVQTATFRLPMSPDFTPPPGAVYMRPYVRSFAATGVLAVLLLEAVDVTYAGTYSQVYQDFSARLTALESVRSGT